MSQGETSFPLHWPAGVPRIKTPEHSHFGERGRKPSMTQALDALDGELRRLGAKLAVISTNVATRLDGRPYANQAKALDPGVAVYFTLSNRRICLPCDKWDRPECNIWAIAKHIDSMRGQQRWGVGSIEQAFAGYAALPERTGPSCWDVLGVGPHASEAEILDAWKRKAKTTHPDAGGSHEAFTELSQAKDIALATAKSRAPRDWATPSFAKGDA